MAIIGTFTRGTDGKFSGSLTTLTLSAKLLFVPETSKSKDAAPDYRVLLGTIEVGAAWQKAARESGRVYWSVKLDDPAFAAPLFASLVGTDDDKTWRIQVPERTPPADSIC